MKNAAMGSKKKIFFAKIEYSMVDNQCVQRTETKWRP